MQFAGLDFELGHAQLGVVTDALGAVGLLFGGAGTGLARPFAQELALVVAVPETAVEDAGEALVPRLPFLFREGAV